MKHIEFGCPYLRDFVNIVIIFVVHVSSKYQVAGVFTKFLPIGDLTRCNKHIMINIYAPASRGSNEERCPIKTVCVMECSIYSYIVTMFVFGIF